MESVKENDAMKEEKEPKRKSVKVDLTKEKKEPKLELVE